LAAYELAIELGADFVEPDLVSTRDGELVARHENEIGGTTDVAAHPEFAGRRTTKSIDGLPVTGWFTEDFTLAEVRTLRARERLPQLRPANSAYDGSFEIPTFQEVVDLVRLRTTKSGQRIGVYPETKHPTYFRSIGLPLEERLLGTLQAAGFAEGRVYIQSFDVGNLRALAARTTLPLVQLLDSPLVGSVPERLDEIASYAQVVGAHKALVSPGFVEAAHGRGLAVHAWTFRAENHFLPPELRRGDPKDAAFARELGDWRTDYERYYGVGVDGVFSDQPELAVAARDGTRPGETG
jgi:glycerophosphoryl diester phosphodiesterase